MKFDKSQLLIYAVTDRAWTGKMSLYEQTEAALKGGSTMVQLREKRLRDDNVEEYLEEAKKMRALTEKYNVPLLIDDNIKLAKACGAESIRKTTINSLEYCCFIHTSSHRETAKVINSF